MIPHIATNHKSQACESACISQQEVPVGSSRFSYSATTIIRLILMDLVPPAARRLVQSWRLEQNATFACFSRFRERLGALMCLVGSSLANNGLLYSKVKCLSNVVQCSAKCPPCPVPSVQPQCGQHRQHRPSREDGQLTRLKSSNPTPQHAQECRGS